MSETVGKLIECDRCGKTYFMPSDRKEVMDYNTIRIVDKYKAMPEGWKDHLEIGLLCDDCEKKYQDFLNEFFGE